LSKSGQKQGDGCLLTVAQDKRIWRLLIGKTLDKLKNTYALWACLTAQEVIADEKEIKLAICTVGEYPKSWDITAQKLAYEQSDPEVKRRLEQEYPTIQVQAIKEDVKSTWEMKRGCVVIVSINVPMRRRVERRSFR